MRGPSSNLHVPFTGPPAGVAEERRKLLGQWLRDMAKRCLLRLYVRLWAPVRNLTRSLAGRCHTAVLVYHRLGDHDQDSISIGVDQFRQHLEIMKRHYEVLDMADFLAGSRCRRVGVVITFDDGYESSYLAARLLREAHLPATFFISTRIVGTDAAFPHDLEKLGQHDAALDWDQVGQMSEWGFHFGTHTAHHVNVAALPLEDAAVEIAAAQNDLLRQLGPKGSEVWFAYPYGRPSDISHEVRAALPACGVSYCFSAYGGVNKANFNPLDIRRQGINHKFTDLAFRAAVEGWKTRRPSAPGR